MPSKEALERVQGQLAKLENGMTALDDVSGLHSQVLILCSHFTGKQQRTQCMICQKLENLYALWHAND